MEDEFVDFVNDAEISVSIADDEYEVEELSLEEAFFLMFGKSAMPRDMLWAE